VTFLLGSIPWGIIISRLFYRTDIREHGSGNIGTTNALRTLGKRGGTAVFVLDFGKGLFAGFVGLLTVTFLLPLAHAQDGQGAQGAAWLLSQDVLTASMMGCTLGHIFSPWLGFRGGKGIAVAAGCLGIAVGWLWMLVEIAVFAAFVLCTRYVSIGSIAAALACPILTLWLFWGDALAIVFCIITGAVIIWAHRGNIRRLLNGTEHRVGSKRST
ncbi:MAG: glycerol-3-phosphate 1-O-acyltransferase PlsY, partial [Coriobacteriales bacterium]|nr:glycerol-3-phosphate 1-O-acyltransferase PlsY [Coriobacteriales bacterium]